MSYTHRLCTLALTVSTALCLIAKTGFGQDIQPLSTLQPRAVRSLNPKTQAISHVLSGMTVRGRVAKDVIQLPGQSETSYSIPPGSRSFSGVLMYHNPVGIRQEPNPKDINRVEVTFLVDKKRVWQTAMDACTVPLEVTTAIPLGQVLTVAVHGEWLGDSISILSPEFSAQQRPASSAYLLNPGEGYVDFMPEGRQALLDAFRPGESVAIKADFGGKASQASVMFEYTPEQGGSAITSTVAVPLQIDASGFARGKALWKVPQQRGPGTLHLQEQIGGNVVYDRSLRIAILPEVPLADVADSTFGVHFSSEGYLFAQDEYASLWGAKWGRVFLRWPIIEPQQGQYDFSRADEVIDVYRAQHMRVLVVIGEDAPAWAGDPGPAYLAAWTKFARASVEHFKDRVDTWDVFNEVDAKYYSKWIKVAAESDIPILNAGIAAVRELDPGGKVVCCSNGTTDPIGYDRRLYSSGVMRGVDIVSMHPYRSVAPEEKAGPNNYLGEAANLRTLVTAQGQTSGIWSTEANWILGPRGSAANAPDIDEHTQAEYVVRVNLLSFAWGIPYFLHMPFFHGNHPQIHLDTLSAYAQMASWFSGASGPRMIEQQDVFAVTATKAGRLVGAVWSVTPGTVALLEGLSQPSFFDFYGNPVRADAENLQVSPSPIYFSAASTSVPNLRLLSHAPSPQWRSLTPINAWTKYPGSTYRPEGNNLHVTSAPTQWGGLFLYPTLQVQPGCYKLGFDLAVVRGSVGVTVMEKGGDKLAVERIGAYANPQPHRSEVRFKATSANPLQIVISGANLAPMATEIVISNVGMTQCD